MPRTECYLDLDIDDRRAKFALGCAFVAATDRKYGLSSPSLLRLGGSELARLPGFHAADYVWSARGPIAASPAPRCRIVVELYPDVPLAAENFRRLCAGDAGRAEGSGLPLRYRGCAVHRVQAGFVLQSGDFVRGNGSGGESVYGKKFKDERPGLLRRHGRAGVLSMGNSGKHSNGSQFFLTLAAAPQCDGKHVVFGRVTSGGAVLRDIEAKAGSEDGKPRVRVKIDECGEFVPGTTARHGFWHDPPEGEGPALFVPVARVLVVATGEAPGKRFEEALRKGGCNMVDVEQHIVPKGEFLGDDIEVYDAILVAAIFQENLPWSDGVLPNNAALCKPTEAVECLKEIVGENLVM